MFFYNYLFKAYCFEVFMEKPDLKNKVIADLHIHSRFSRACSKNITIPNLVRYAKMKGINLLGTGDFSHPTWLKEIKELREENGVFYYNDFPFVLSGEISLIYTQERGRRVHLCLLVPSFSVVDKINAYLDTKGRRDYDGRPIFKISCEDFVREMKRIDDKIEVFPAHIWTPWFGVFGSKTGFDSLGEAFGSQVENVYAIETGMSSDPKMNWKIKELHNKSIISFSDSHSYWPWRLGRESTIFNSINSYDDLIKQIRENSFFATIETDPAYGKYHFDGHRVCNFSCSPEESRKLNGICPKCKKQLTVGVEYRVEELKDTDEKPGNAKPYYVLLPLHELIALAKASSLATQKTWKVYNSLIEKFGNEFNVLLHVTREKLADFLRGDESLVELIMLNREGKIRVKPGYDGVYGEAMISERQEKLL